MAPERPRFSIAIARFWSVSNSERRLSFLRYSPFSFITQCGLPLWMSGTYTQSCVWWSWFLFCIMASNIHKKHWWNWTCRHSEWTRSCSVCIDSSPAGAHCVTARWDPGNHRWLRASNQARHPQPSLPYLLLFLQNPVQPTNSRMMFNASKYRSSSSK